VEFEWDEAKSQRNLIERGLSFELALTLFEGFYTEHVDARIDYGEVRMKAFCASAGKVVVCVFTDRDQKRRIISLRYANRRERDAYRAAEIGRHR
jgi:uncharacterized DUF497 family protein